jgi:hypothetical protein
MISCRPCIPTKSLALLRTKQFVTVTCVSDRAKMIHLKWSDQISKNNNDDTNNVLENILGF